MMALSYRFLNQFSCARTDKGKKQAHTQAVWCYDSWPSDWIHVMCFGVFGLLSSFSCLRFSRSQPIMMIVWKFPKTKCIYGTNNNNKNREKHKKALNHLVLWLVTLQCISYTPRTYTLDFSTMKCAKKTFFVFYSCYSSVDRTTKQFFVKTTTTANSQQLKVFRAHFATSIFCEARKTNTPKHEMGKSKKKKKKNGKLNSNSKLT